MKNDERRTGALRRPFLCMGALLLAACLGLSWHMTRPVVAVLAGDELLAAAPAKAGTTFSVRFIHSVQRTPVEELFAVNEAADGFILRATRYESFGVGLPFLASDGVFRREGDRFVMDGMERPIPRLDLRPGVSTELTLCLAGEAVPLFERVPLGSLVRVRVLPRYRALLAAFFPAPQES